MGLLKRIHVNQHIIRSNAQRGGGNPVFTVKYAGETIRAYRVKIEGPSEVVYRPNAPLSCGARVWIETHEPVSLDTGNGGFDAPLI